jgi:hypothetical protein
LIEQRVARLSQDKWGWRLEAGGWSNRTSLQLPVASLHNFRLDAAQRQAVFRHRKGQVDPRQRLNARDDLSRIAADAIGKLGQNAGNLLLLGQLKLAPLIVQLDNRDRLDI